MAPVTYLLIRINKMSGSLIALVGLIYAYVSLEQYMKGNIGLGLAYTGYAFANIGLYLLASK